MPAGVIAFFSCSGCYWLSSVAISPALSHGYTRLKPSEKRDWDSRIPSTLHAALITLASIYALKVADTFDTERLAKVPHAPQGITEMFECEARLSVVAHTSPMWLLTPNPCGCSHLPHGVAHTYPMWLLTRTPCTSLADVAGGRDRPSCTLKRHRGFNWHVPRIFCPRYPHCGVQLGASECAALSRAFHLLHLQLHCQHVACPVPASYLKLKRDLLFFAWGSF